MTDSASNPLSQEADQAPAGLDDLLASVLTGEDEHPKERERLKGACDLQGMFLVMLNFGPKKKSRIWEVLMHY